MNFRKYAKLLLLIMLPVCSQAQDRILVVSGGGARGAWGGGLAQALVQDSSFHYKAVVGTSTGSLLAPLILLEDFDKLREGYTTIRDKDIFNVKPFKTSGPNRGKLKEFQAFLRILIRKRTLGESKNLRKTIRRFFTEDMYTKIKNSNKEQIATVVNITKDQVEFKSSKDYDYEDMVNWMWASSNQPVFMSLHKTIEIDSNGDKMRNFYVDGGVKEAVPLIHGIDLACQDDEIKNIDVIIHSTLDPRTDTNESGGVMSLLGRTIELFLTEVRQNDLVAAKRQFNVIESIEDECVDLGDDKMTITYYFMPKEDYDFLFSDLLFDEGEMSTLWDRGRGHLQVKEETLPELRIQVVVPRSQLCNGAIFADN